MFAGTDYMVEQYKPDAAIQNDSLQRQFPLRSDAELALDEYINLLIDWRWSLDPILGRNYPQLIKDALEIINMLKEEFDIE